MSDMQAGTPEVDGEVEGGLDEPTQLEPEQGTLDLAGPEDDHSLADWEAATAAVLRKAKRMSEDDPDDLVWAKLTTRTLDGIEVTPLGTAATLEQLATSGRPTRAGEWDVRAHLAGAEPKALNEAALIDLDGGATSLWVEIDEATDLATLLDGVLLDLAPVVLDSTEPLATAQAFLDHAGGGDLHPDANLGGTGDAVVEVARLALAAGVRGVVVDATTLHDRGASEAQELGYSMALAATYLRKLVGAGIGLDDAVDLLEFRYAVTDEQFVSIAKLRAARRLWARVLELSEVSTTSTGHGAQRQHAVTSRPMMSVYDSYVNMLRTTVAAFAAGVGGADSVTVLPFDSPLGQPETLGRRVARNTSALLMFESHVATVTDPAGGSYVVEKLTDDLAAAAWVEFGRIEEEGLEALQSRIDGVVAERDQQVAERKRPITGLTEFPNLDEVLPLREGSAGRATARRYGASFEALRDEPATASVFLATLGSIASHTARASFATNLFAAGGVSVQPAGATEGVEDLLAAYDGQAVVCLAGADPTYADWGADATSALREAGARHVIIAGKPSDYADDSCAMGIDALDFLTRTREKLS